MNSHAPAPVTGGAAPAVTSDPDAPADAGARPLPDADEADADRPGDSTGVPVPAVTPHANALSGAAA